MQIIYFPMKIHLKLRLLPEPKRYLQELANEKYHCNKENIYKDWKELIVQGVLGDILFVCTQDNCHVEPGDRRYESGI